MSAETSGMMADRQLSLYRDSVPVHTALSVQMFVDITKTAVVPQLPHSSDMSPLFLRTKLWLHMCGRFVIKSVQELYGKPSYIE